MPASSLPDRQHSCAPGCPKPRPVGSFSTVQPIRFIEATRSVKALDCRLFQGYFYPIRSLLVPQRGGLAMAGTSIGDLPPPAARSRARCHMPNTASVAVPSAMAASSPFPPLFQLECRNHHTTQPAPPSSPPLPPARAVRHLAPHLPPPLRRFHSAGLPSAMPSPSCILVPPHHPRPALPPPGIFPTHARPRHGGRTISLSTYRRAGIGG